MQTRLNTCGACGASMIERLVAPCLDCGGEPKEVKECLNGQHTYGHFKLFDNNLLCDFCDADMPSTDPLYWGFPKNFDWDIELKQDHYERLEGLKPQLELACSKCDNTLRRQNFIIQNARKNNVALPKEYWPHL